MGRRREPRTDATLKVRLWGMDATGHPFSEDAHTHNVSREGALLEGVRSRIKVGDIVGLKYGENKGRYRVVWVVADENSHLSRLGLATLTPGKCIWDVPLAPPTADNYEPPRGRERRRYPRLRCGAGVELRAEGASAPLLGKVGDLSVGGCYVEMMIPLKNATRLDLTLRINNNVKIQTKGVVVNSQPGFGIGIKFVETSPENEQHLRRYVESLLNAVPRAADKKLEGEDFGGKISTPPPRFTPIR